MEFLANNKAIKILDYDYFVIVSHITLYFSPMVLYFMALLFCNINCISKGEFLGVSVLTLLLLVLLKKLFISAYLGNKNNPWKKMLLIIDCFSLDKSELVKLISLAFFVLGIILFSIVFKYAIVLLFNKDYLTYQGLVISLSLLSLLSYGFGVITCFAGKKKLIMAKSIMIEVYTTIIG